MALKLKGLIFQTIAIASPQVISGIIPCQLVSQCFIASRFCKSSQATAKSVAVAHANRNAVVMNFMRDCFGICRMPRNDEFVNLLLMNVISNSNAKYSYPKSPRIMSCPFSKVSRKGTMVIRALAISGYRRRFIIRPPLLRNRLTVQGDILGMSFRQFL